MERKSFRFYDRILGFKYAIQGMWDVYKQQPNMWLISVITIGVILTGILLHASPLEWCFLLTAILLVWIAEVFNTALEFLVDLVSPGPHPLARKAKDAAAGAVLVTVVLAFLIGLIILGPKIYYLFAAQ